ncbi:Uncharacterised protein [Staphylococcus argenteus]|nr:Uncharacterised protein [Staphylococcus argenteus]
MQEVQLQYKNFSYEFLYALLSCFFIQKIQPQYSEFSEKGCNNLIKMISYYPYYTLAW